MTRAGTITNPPPTPKKPVRKPTINPAPRTLVAVFAPSCRDAGSSAPAGGPGSALPRRWQGRGRGHGAHDSRRGPGRAGRCVGAHAEQHGGTRDEDQHREAQQQHVRIESHVRCGTGIDRDTDGAEGKAVQPGHAPVAGVPGSRLQRRHADDDETFRRRGVRGLADDVDQRGNGQYRPAATQRTRGLSLMATPSTMAATRCMGAT